MIPAYRQLDVVSGRETVSAPDINIDQFLQMSDQSLIEDRGFDRCVRNC